MSVELTIETVTETVVLEVQDHVPAIVTIDTIPELRETLDDKVDKVAGYSLVADDEIAKLLTVEQDAQKNTVSSVAGKQGDVLLDKSDVGMGAVDNTSDADKPVSTAVAAALASKLDKTEVKQTAGTSTTDVMSQKSVTDEFLALDKITINAGKDLPLKRKVRSGSSTALTSVAKNVILDVKVYGARAGKYYRLEWIGNGAILSGSARFDILFSEYDKSTYSTDSESGRVDAIILGDIPSASIDTSSEIITRTFVSSRIEGLSFSVTYRPSAIGGQSLALNNSMGRAYIIDENNYTYRTSDVITKDSLPPVKYELSSSGDITYEWESYGALYKIVFGINGFNDLPNFKSMYKSESITSPSFRLLGVTSTDWLPPLTLTANADGDTGGRIFTGGNHGSSGSAGGSKTARNILYTVDIDGKDKPFTNETGMCSKITISIANEIMAYNTITLGRYVVRQFFNLVLTAGEVSVECSVSALEACQIRVDYGCQAWTEGFRESYIFVGGDDIRKQYADSANSGKSSEKPNVSGVVLQSISGQMAIWMDREYGAASGQYVDQASPLALLSNGKAYNPVVMGGYLYYLSLAKGASYKWRGGYAWQNTGIQGSSLDSVFDRSVRGVSSRTYIAHDASVVMF